MTVAFTQMLLDGYLKRQKEIGQRMTQGAYALHIGFKPATFSNYMNGKRVPTDKDELEKLEKHFGQEVYDALDIPRPDPRLWKIIRSWGRLPDAVKKELAEGVRRAEARAPVIERGGKGLEVSQRERET